MLAGLVTRLVHSLATLALVQVHPAKRHSAFSACPPQKKKLCKKTQLCDEQKSEKNKSDLFNRDLHWLDAWQNKLLWILPMIRSNCVTDGLD